MTLKHDIRRLVEQLPDDSPLLIQLLETLRLNQALQESISDVTAERTYTAAEFLAKVQERWPRQ